MNLIVKHLLIVVIFFSTTINAQNLKSIYKNIVKEDYNDVQAEYNKSNNDFNKEEKILFELSKCILYSKSKYQSFKPREAFNIYKSISIINLSQNEQTNINEFLSKYTYTITGVYDTIIKGVFLESKTLNTIESYEEAIQICNDCKYKIELLNLKEVTAYKQALNSGNVEVLEQFLINYPTSKLKDEIEGLLHTKAFERATLLNTIISLNEYILKYSNSKLMSNAYRYRDSLVLKSTNKTYKDYVAFIQNYPNSFFNSSISNQLPDLLFNEISVDIDYYKMLEFIKKYPDDSRVEDITSRIYKMKYYEISVNKVNNLKIKENCKKFYRNLYRVNHLIEIYDLGFFDTLGLFKYDNIFTSNDYEGINIVIVSLNGKYGIIDSLGVLTTPIMYDELKFEKGFIKAKLNNKWGVIDYQGKQIITIKYNEIKILEDGYAFVQIIDENINQSTDLLKNINDSNYVKWGVIDISGTIIIPVKFEKIDYNKSYDKLFYGNYAVFQINEKWGIINRNGKEVFEFKFDGISKGLAKGELNGKKYIVDTLGKIFFNSKFENIYPLSDKLIVVESNKKYGILDINGNEILPVNFDNIQILETFENIDLLSNKLILLENNGKYGLIDINGNEILPVNFNRISVLNNNLIEYSDNAKSGLINSNGKILCPLKYHYVDDLNNGFAVAGILVDEVPVNNQYSSDYLPDETKHYALINEKGDELTKFKYTEINHFQNGKAKVTDLNGKSGFIDLKGKDLTQYKNTSIIIGKSNGKYGLIDSNGRELTKFKYEEIKIEHIRTKEYLDGIEYVSEDGYNYNFFRAKYNGNYVLINKNGVELFPLSTKYKIEQYLGNNYIAESDGLLGILEKKGNELTPFKYSNIDYIAKDIFLVKENCEFKLLKIINH